MDTRSQQILGWYQVLGGVTGLLSTGALASKTGDAGSARLLLIVPATLFVTLGLAGGLLLRGHPWGKPLSVLVQAVQLPSLFTTPLSYELYGPLSLTVAVEPLGWKLSFGFQVGGGFNFGIGTEPLATAVGLNIAAAAVLWWMLRRPAARPLPTSGGLVTR